ncbi:hypothetical protein CMV_005889 [Castanea mollissima]|uniref:F-box/LRR-repeat protein 15/At3g58940/PEG3-like LRR domain-containing protein n=1 Tax=Castanea mollissima TaxID=60419 RepID=A0A8J4RRX1_9ROSI|nr:hypothetical protein CMV_005889 [Castanea mollissima]
MSKSWKQAWNSLPRYDFSFYGRIHRKDYHKPVWEKQSGGADLEEKIDKFVKSVDEVLLPLRDHKTIIQCFRLSVTLCDDKYASCIDNWMKLANRNHMETLYLNLINMEKVKRYVLPKTAFSVGSLAKLTLKGCKLLGDYFGDNMNKFICLRKLTLLSVEVDDLTVKKILCFCALLEEFTQSWCMKAEFVHIGYAPKLKKAILNGVKRIKIEAPNLEELYCRGHPTIIGRLDSDSFACSNVKKNEHKEISFTSEELSRDLPIPPVANFEHLKLYNVRVQTMQDYTALLDGSL